MKRFLTLFTLSLLLYGCEGGTEYFTEIHNLSSSKITIKYQSYFIGNVDSITLERGEINKKLQFQKLGGIASNQHCEQWLADAYIINQNGDTCQASLQDESRYASYTERTAKMPGTYEHTCRIVITDSDF